MSLMKITGLVSSWALRKPATRLYPFVKRETYPHTRGHIDIDIGKCTFCTLCEKKCPTDAIAVDRAAKTWSIDRLRCISCNACVEACPRKCLSMANTYSPAMLQHGIQSFVQNAPAPAEK
jgi:formate hydrogenlyase subunit 6/NADH:ubiquinone oxidoreductase subunit I